MGTDPICSPIRSHSLTVAVSLTLTELDFELLREPAEIMACAGSGSAAGQPIIVVNVNETGTETVESSSR